MTSDGTNAFNGSQIQIKWKIEMKVLQVSLSDSIQIRNTTEIE